MASSSSARGAIFQRIEKMWSAPSGNMLLRRWRQTAFKASAKREQIKISISNNGKNLLFYTLAILRRTQSRTNRADWFRFAKLCVSLTTANCSRRSPSIEKMRLKNNPFSANRCCCAKATTLDRPNGSPQRKQCIVGVSSKNNGRTHKAPIAALRQYFL